MKVRNLIGIYLYFFMIFCVLFPICSYYYISDAFIRAFIYISFSGGIGATLYCIRGFYQNIAEDTFDGITWIWWYIFRPLIGFIAGIFVLFIMGGLIGLNNSQVTFTTTGIMGYCALSFLSGFCFTKFVEKLEKIMEILI